MNHPGLAAFSGEFLLTSRVTRHDLGAARSFGGRRTTSDVTSYVARLTCATRLRPCTRANAARVRLNASRPAIAAGIGLPCGSFGLRMASSQRSFFERSAPSRSLRGVAASLHERSHRHEGEASRCARGQYVRQRLDTSAGITDAIVEYDDRSGGQVLENQPHCLSAAEDRQTTDEHPAEASPALVAHLGPSYGSTAVQSRVALPRASRRDPAARRRSVQEPRHNVRTPRASSSSTIAHSDTASPPSR